MSNNDPSLGDSLAELGIRFAKGQLIAFVAALISGLLVAYILPQFYGEIVGRGMDQIGECKNCWRDTVNKYAMTVLTVGVSFLVAFFVSRRFRK